MRLRRIKLAGFKSFVDPTTVELPSPRTAIIGPNGCGKSNIIDAVRWVMGESSAKQLRGDSMEDVIFNGSSARPPVSRASVDLVFDNSDHSLGGQWAKYSEIAIRREVTRDGQSAYFLNGTRCRRRDIADIFLGTGLGPRSYAIIEQGMISRIIEARPEELRIHLEEAAGITKYKERRRETETRIRHTRENLERLDDLRRELDKQIAHLARQAEQAERYKALKEEERRLRAEWLALRWRALEARRQAEEKALGAKETEVEAALAAQRELEAEIERARERHAELNEALNAVQAEYYRLGSDISRIEQTIAHRRETRRRHEADLAQLEKAWRELKAHVEEDRNKLDYVARSVADKEPALAALEETRARSAAALGEAEKAMAEWQQAWEAFHRREAEVSGRLRAEQARQEQLERHLAQLEARLARLDEERARLDEAPLVAEREQALQDEARIEAELEALGRRFEDNTRELNAARGRIQESESALAAARNRVQDLRGTLSSLEALQAAALGKDQAEAQAWLRRAALDDRPRLAETLQVEPGWEAAVEAVLGETLEAVCVARDRRDRPRGPPGRAGRPVPGGAPGRARARRSPARPPAGRCRVPRRGAGGRLRGRGSGRRGGRARPAWRRVNRS
ncbi:MAG: hypothetical protein KatS3mg121_0003 [Gammaproteobacteria bacterium]|nr:MAG: hypothetical protein KatS3mg121_0003 [Gammaproteobacteria bacterium]